MAQHVIVVDYNPEWPVMFAAEAGMIRRVLGSNCVAVHHIGSTAVPGLAAKPVIDIMPVVKSLNDVDCLASEFVKNGYEYLGEFGMAGRRYMRKGGDERTHQIHIFAEKDTLNITRHLAFRDYMRVNSTVRETYAALKRSLAKEYPYDIEAYCDSKAAFVKAYEDEALAAYRATAP